MIEKELNLQAEEPHHVGALSIKECMAMADS
jgi:hypothetical protein